MARGSSARDRVRRPQREYASRKANDGSNPPTTTRPAPATNRGGFCLKRYLLRTPLNNAPIVHRIPPASLGVAGQSSRYKRGGGKYGGDQGSHGIPPFGLCWFDTAYRCPIVTLARGEGCDHHHKLFETCVARGLLTGANRTIFAQTESFTFDPSGQMAKQHHY